MREWTARSQGSTGSDDSFPHPSLRATFSRWEKGNSPLLHTAPACLNSRMFFSCPHCRDLVVTDQETNLPPVLCPRCGGRLRADVPRKDPPREKAVATSAAVVVAGNTGDPSVKSGPSLASFLQGTTPATTENSAHLTQEARDNETSDTVEETAIDGQSPASVIPDPPTVVERGEIEAIAVATDEIATAAPESAASPTATQYAGPSFARQRAQPLIPARTAKWQWAALVVLATLLTIQVLVADRARLAADASWRPVIASLCAVAGCSVPAWHQPSAFAMLSRDVSPIPETRGGLNVQATFRNDAPWPQAWPVLLLSLSDADGRVLGSRAFLPKEYLGAAATQTELAPGQSAQIALKLHEPNPDVVAFSFDFR